MKWNHISLENTQFQGWGWESTICAWNSLQPISEENDSDMKRCRGQCKGTLNSQIQDNLNNRPNNDINKLKHLLN